MSRLPAALVLVSLVGAVRADSVCGYVVWEDDCSNCTRLSCVCSTSTNCTHAHVCAQAQSYQVGTTGAPLLEPYEHPCETTEHCQRRDSAKPCHDVSNWCVPTFLTLEIISTQTRYRQIGTCGGGIG
jgi:hypothetical protein